MQFHENNCDKSQLQHVGDAINRRLYHRNALHIPAVLTTNFKQTIGYLPQ